MLGRDDVVKLVRVVAQTREIEICCDECFERLDGLAETELSGGRRERRDAVGSRSPRQVRGLSWRVRGA